MSNELARWRKLYKDFWGVEPLEQFEIPTLKIIVGSRTQPEIHIAKLQATIAAANARIEELETLLQHILSDATYEGNYPFHISVVDTDLLDAAEKALGEKANGNTKTETPE